MQSAIILGVAALASTAHASLGYGTIINACSYPVSLCNVPSDDGVHKEYTTTLQPGDKYSQQWTPLLNGNGWSMKLNPESTSASIMQFEYTWAEAHPEDLWFDMSYVNGNPFLNDWFIETDCPDTCVVKQTAYLYSTDDANGMQPMCSPDTSVTVTLCRKSDGSYDNGSGSVASSSSAAPVASVVASVVSNIIAPLIPSVPAPVPQIATKAADSPVIQATTFATSTSSTSSTTAAPIVPTVAPLPQSQEYNFGGVTITQVDTAIVTAYVTATAYDNQGHGHGHWARHAHARRHN